MKTRANHIHLEIFCTSDIHPKLPALCLRSKWPRFLENNAEWVYLQCLEAADPVKNLEQGSTATLPPQASPQMKDEMETGNAAAVVLRVGSWTWIHLSCLLFTKYYDMPSPQNRERFLQETTQLLSLLPWPPARRLPLRLSKVSRKLDWQSCHEVSSDWIFWPG
jgi:hypothetical protein